MGVRNNVVPDSPSYDEALDSAGFGQGCWATILEGNHVKKMIAEYYTPTLLTPVAKTLVVTLGWGGGTAP